MADIAACLESGRTDWNTPRVIVGLVAAFNGGPPELDPCSNPTSIVGARRGLWAGGLTEEWSTCGGLVYVNPPYGREIKEWVRKMVREASLGAEIIALLPARPDTAWWRAMVDPDDCPPSVICFWRGRLKFLGASHGAPFPSAIAYWGARDSHFADLFGGLGWCVPGSTSEFYR